ncbi:MAG: peptide chain release factor N(5)-glutamine methyltransferase [Verrucomicrobiales bacterium]|nr:peptide chain release factor N(5)-glutamine methyltransferase [Verrucomicrobiales bacterium]
MTVLDVLQRSAAYLAERGVESARLNAELIVSHVLKKPRLRLYLDFDQVIPEADLAVARDLVRRRGRREPLQHLTGTTGFLNLNLQVTPEVLVPRPETEVLAQLAIQNLKEAPPDRVPVALDFGTGSGCLAIALAQAVPESEVHALDISQGALAVARRNAVSNGTGGIQFHEGDGFAALEGRVPVLRRRFSLVVTNPPYIPTSEIATLEPEVRDYDPRIALDGGSDGLAFYRRLALEAADWLRPGGKLMAEFGDGQASALKELFEGAGWMTEVVEKDLSGRDRVLIVRPPTD